MNRSSAFITMLSIMLGLAVHVSAGNKPAFADSSYTIKVKNIAMVVNAAVGGRITSFKLNDKEVIAGKVVHPNFYGSTLWLSPEGKWKGQGILDNGMYQVDKAGISDLRITSHNDSVRGFAFKKQFTASAKDTSIIIKYTITNISKDMQEVAPWEVTRVPTGGIAFFAKVGEDLPTPNKMYPLMTISDAAGIVWYPYDDSKTSAQKLFINGNEGWVAYVKSGVLFIKKFPLIKTAEAAPNEKNLEMYVNKDKTYIELENQGAYAQLQHAASLNYEVKWYVREIPAGMNAEVGSPAMVNYVRNVLKLKK